LPQIDDDPVSSGGAVGSSTSSLAAFWLGFWRGTSAEEGRGLIAARGRRNRNDPRWISSRRSRRPRRVLQTEVDDDVGADMRVPLVSEEKKRKGYRFGMLAMLGCGPTLAVG
jgi:hypothetical protein